MRTKRTFNVKSNDWEPEVKAEPPGPVESEKFGSSFGSSLFND